MTHLDSDSDEDSDFDYCSFSDTPPKPVQVARVSDRVESKLSRHISLYARRQNFKRLLRIRGFSFIHQPCFNCAESNQRRYFSFYYSDYVCVTCLRSGLSLPYSPDGLRLWELDLDV